MTPVSSVNNFLNINIQILRLFIYVFFLIHIFTPQKNENDQSMFDTSEDLGLILSYRSADILTYLLTYSMQHTHSWEANRFSARQEIPSILWNPKVHYCIHKSPPTIPILSQLDPVHTPTSHFLKIYLNIILPSTPGSSKWTLALRFPPSNPVYASLLPIHATCPAYLIFLDFITRTIFGEQYKSLSSSLCSFLHSPVTSSLIDPNILFKTPFSNTLSLRYFLNFSNQVSHPYNTTGKITVLYILIFIFLDSNLQIYLGSKNLILWIAKSGYVVLNKLLIVSNSANGKLGRVTCW